MDPQPPPIPLPLPDDDLGSWCTDEVRKPKNAMLTLRALAPLLSRRGIDIQRSGRALCTHQALEPATRMTAAFHCASGWSTARSALFVPR
jgi:hypothetical protein